MCKRAEICEDSTASPKKEIPIPDDCITCLVCLEKNPELVRCCTRKECRAMVHIDCWKRWRHSLRFNYIKSYIKGTRVQISWCGACREGDSLFKDGIKKFGNVDMNFGFNSLTKNRNIK
eukprot:GHVP01019956.1.p2 GENE.GHVP01019956.1~~GHVP01019956.1.p2  ORF type:complete len:119 (+),score=12.07 GHVP01019956.1:987-1343(+)